MHVLKEYRLPLIRLLFLVSFLTLSLSSYSTDDLYTPNDLAQHNAQAMQEINIKDDLKTIFSSINNKSTFEDRLVELEKKYELIEEQMNIADEVNNDSLMDISSSIQFLDKEVRKLWDLSNKRNKVNISKLLVSTAELEKSIINISKTLASHDKKIDSATSYFSTIQDSGNKIDNIQLTLKTIETQLMLLDDSVQALNNYKKQLNQTVLEIQTEISAMQQLEQIEESAN